jgi:hypothetical protein
MTSAHSLAMIKEPAFTLAWLGLLISAFGS